MIKQFTIVKKIGIAVKIQPTLWEINQEDYRAIIEHYLKLGINWYTFHAGSFESLWDKNIVLNHIQPEKWRNIIHEIENLANERNLKIRIPKIFLNDSENIKYQAENETYCQNGGEGIQIWLQEDGIKATFCPLLAEVYPQYIFDIEKDETRLIKGKKNNCMICGKCLDKKVINKSINKDGREFILDNKVLHNVCRYYSEKIKYG